MSSAKEIHKTMHKNITDLDLKRYLPETNSPNDNVIKYSELADIDSLDEILPHDKSFKIVLIEDSYNSGHWCAILRYGKTYEWFDSYGIGIDEELKFIDSLQKKLLGQDRKYLTKLLEKLPKKTTKVVWNKRKLQSIANDSNTCGRWCILRIVTMTDFGFDLKQFHEFIDTWKKKLKLSPDEMVSLWVK